MSCFDPCNHIDNLYPCLINVVKEIITISRPVCQTNLVLFVYLLFEKQIQQLIRVNLALRSVKIICGHLKTNVDPNKASFTCHDMCE